MFEIPAGGRRFRALELLVKAKRLVRTTPIPCSVRDADSPNTAQEDSLAENVQAIPLHPLDQFRAFKVLIDAGAGETEIAARFFVAPAVVRQRLRLASVEPSLLALYAEEAMTLEQLVVFTECRSRPAVAGLGSDLAQPLPRRLGDPPDDDRRRAAHE